MTHDGSQIVPATGPGKSLFVSGIVVGVVLGIAAGHLLLFARGRSAQSVTTAEEEFARQVAVAPRFAAVGGPVPREAASSSILEFDGPEDVGRVRLSDESTAKEHLQYFPEAMNAPGADLVTHADPIPADRPAMTGPLQMTADTSRSSDAPPQALQPSPAAAPIDKATSDRQTMARSIIRDEMPEATAQEREIWLEVLQGLPADDIKGILRMRKHIGAGAALEFCPPLSLPASLADPPGRAGDVDTGTGLLVLAEKSEVGRRLQQITRHNLSNRYTVAFKQQIPVLVEAAPDDPAGIAITRVIRDMRQGDVEATGRSLDIAMDGPVFLQVRRNDETRYTRDGRLTLNEQGRLKLLGPADDWLIDPPLTVPDDAMAVAISEQGEVSAVMPGESEAQLGRLRLVRFVDPSALADGREGLYQETSASGVPHESPAGPNVIPGHLEGSNVSIPPGGSCRLDDAATDRR